MNYLRYGKLRQAKGKTYPYYFLELQAYSKRLRIGLFHYESSRSGDVPVDLLEASKATCKPMVMRATMLPVRNMA